MTQSEPDRRAAQPQHVQQQVQIQVTTHDGKLTITPGGVKWFFAPGISHYLFALEEKTMIYRPHRLERVSKP